jgi:hypothetical protein
MANYCGRTRTNYFRVTDEEKFRQVMANVLCSDDDLEIFEEDGESGKKFGFCCCGVIQGTKQLLDDEDCEEDYDEFIRLLQEVVADDDAIIITEVGYEKLRYLVGRSEIITKTGFKVISLRDATLEAAKTLLGNPDYDTEVEY